LATSARPVWSRIVTSLRSTVSERLTCIDSTNASGECLSMTCAAASRAACDASTGILNGSTWHCTGTTIGSIAATLAISGRA